MGSQRRFEETSRLIDRFDTLVESDFRRSGQPGKLRRIAARAERASDPSAPDVTYIRAIHLADPGNPEGRTDDSRFYEAYWADEMAEMRSTWGVIKWILRQVWRPVAMARTPWSERQRLRRAFLAEMLEDKALWPKDTLETDFRALLDLYREFDHPDWLRASAAGQDRRKAGSFDAFLAMIAERNRGKPDRVDAADGAGPRLAPPLCPARGDHLCRPSQPAAGDPLGHRGGGGGRAVRAGAHSRAPWGRLAWPATCRFRPGPRPAGPTRQRWPSG
jgi:hypothetical protein